jgi:hypothetical protein
LLPSECFFVIRSGTATGRQKKKNGERFHVLKMWGTFPILFVEAVVVDVSPEPQFIVILWELKPATSWSLSQDPLNYIHVSNKHSALLSSECFFFLFHFLQGEELALQS